MMFTLRMLSPCDRFGAGAATSLLGQVVPVSLGANGAVTGGVVTHAEVVDDGHGVLVTLSVGD